MKLTEKNIDVLYELPLNDQILTLMRIPTEPILGQKAGKAYRLENKKKKAKT